MSGLHENQKAARRIRSLINKYAPTKGQKYYFVTSYPRSDMGKGTLVAQLLAATPNSDAIKFDGLLNTNENGRHTARGHDDFGIYEQFNEDRVWGREHYLLGGELYRDFITEFGEFENLQINPHLSLYLEYRIHKMWHDVGSPEHLFVEIGGVMSDPEVEPLFAPLIQRLSHSLDARTILLCETAYNGEYIKTKSVQDAVRELRRHHITPWLIVAREPQEFRGCTESEHLEFERVLSERLNQAFGVRFGRIFSVPFYENLHEYTGYIKQRFTPLLAPLSGQADIVIATSNKSKFADFSLYLGDTYTLSQSTSHPSNIEIPEGISSIEDNAIAKARAWSILTGKIAIGDDTGFFIDGLNGEPGVALRRWGGELGEDATNADFWVHLQKKTRGLDNLDCYFEQCIAICSPKGDVQLVYSYNPGKLNKEKLELPYNGTGYPLGAAFEATNRGKAWDEMSGQEKREFDATLIANLHAALHKVTSD